MATEQIAAPTPAPDRLTPAVVKRLTAIEHSIQELTALARDREAAEDRRYALIAQLIDPTLELDSLLRQLFGLGRRQNQDLRELAEAVHQELTMIRSAFVLSVGAADLGADPGAEARAAAIERERGGA